MEQIRRIMRPTDVPDTGKKTMKLLASSSGNVDFINALEL
jgi:hypothetical protein